MGQPMQDSQGGTTPASSLLSSVAGLLESGMMGVFGTGNNVGVSNEVSSSRGAPTPDASLSKREHVQQTKKTSGLMGAAPPVKNQMAKRVKTHKQASDSDDMPELDRLGRSTCPASSEEEADAAPSSSSSMPEACVVRRGVEGREGDGSSESSTANNTSGSDSSSSKASDGAITANNSSGGSSASEATRQAYNSSAISARRAAASRAPPSKIAAASNAARWRRPGLSSSSASTLVAGLSPGSIPSRIGTVGSDSGAWHVNQGGSDNTQGDSTPARVQGLSTISGIAAMQSESGVSGMSKKPVPFPLDLSIIGGPTRPRSTRSSNSNYSGAPRSSRPVVLAGAALEQLDRMRRAKVDGATGASNMRPGLGDVNKSAESRAKGGLKEAPVRLSRDSHAARAEHMGPGSRGFDALSDENDIDVEGGALEMRTALEGRSPPPPPGRQARAMQAEESDDAAPPACSPRLAGHLRSPLPEDAGIGGAKEHNGRSRAVFRGRGARPTTWTERDVAASGLSLSPPGCPLETTGPAMPAAGETSHMRLVRQAPGSGDTAEVNLGLGVSPGGSSVVSGWGAGGGGDAVALPNIKYGRSIATPEQARSKEKPSSTLAEIAADIALRGSIAGVELIPGLGRSAFEHISVSPANAPIRELATAAAAAAAQNDAANAPAGETQLGDQQAMLSTSAVMGNMTEAPKRWPGSSSQTRSTISESKRSRSNVADSERVSQSSAVPQQRQRFTPMVAMPSPPSLNQEHAPGQVFRPVHGSALVKHNQPRPNMSGIGVAKIPPFRLSSSNRLTSFESSKKGSPSPFDRRAGRSAAGRDDGTMRDEGGNSVARAGAQRPRTIDMLSSFGSNSGCSWHDQGGSRSRSTSRSRSRTRSGPVRVNTLQSHPEEANDDEMVAPLVGISEQKSWRHGVGGVDMRSGSSEGKGRSFRDDGDNAWSTSRTRRRSRSRSSSTGSATHRSLSQGRDVRNDGQREEGDEWGASPRERHHRSNRRRHSQRESRRDDSVGHERYADESHSRRRSSSRGSERSHDSRGTGHHKRRSSGDVNDISSSRGRADTRRGRTNITYDNGKNYRTHAGEYGDAHMMNRSRDHDRPRPASTSESSSRRTSHNMYGTSDRTSDKAIVSRSVDARESDYGRSADGRPRTRVKERRKEKGTRSHRGSRTEYHSDHERSGRRGRVKIRERNAVSERERVSEIERGSDIEASDSRPYSSRAVAGGHHSGRRSSRRSSRDMRPGGDSASHALLAVQGKRPKNATEKTLPSTPSNNSVLLSPTGATGRFGIPSFRGRGSQNPSSRRRASSVGSEPQRSGIAARSRHSNDGHLDAQAVMGSGGGCGSIFSSRLRKMFVCYKEPHHAAKAEAAAAAARRAAAGRDQFYSGSFHKNAIVHSRNQQPQQQSSHLAPAYDGQTGELMVHSQMTGHHSIGGNGSITQKQGVFAGTANGSSARGKQAHQNVKKAPIGSLRPSPPDSGFGSSAMDARQLSQLYGSPSPIVEGSREMERKADGVASGNDSNTSGVDRPLDRSGRELEDGSEEEGGVRVQHFLRTSQLHSKGIPLSGRSDSSGELAPQSGARGRSLGAKA